MLALIGVTGLAVDMGHLYLNKSRLQHAVEACALSAAKTLDNTSDTASASSAGLDMFNKVLASAGNQELADAGVSPSIEFSHTVQGFGSAGQAYFVHVSANFTQNSFLIQALADNLKTLDISASAVAGPSSALDTNGVPTATPQWNANPAAHWIVLYPYLP